MVIVSFVQEVSEWKCFSQLYLPRLKQKNSQK